MVVVKRLNPEFPRMGYEVQKGLMIDMPGGDGQADIIKGEDGSLTLSEDDGKYQVTLKNVALSDLVEHDVRLKLHYGPESNHVILENMVIDSPTSTIISYEGDNYLTGNVLSGHNYIEMTGQMIADSFIKDSTLDRAKLNNSSIKRSTVRTSLVDHSRVANSNVDGASVTDDSLVELSDLFGDEVTNAAVAGVHSGWDGSSYDLGERRFKDGYFVGNGKNARQHDFDHGYVQVADEEAYADGFAKVILNRDLPFKDDSYRPSDELKERLVEGFKAVPEDYRYETVEMASFLQDIVGFELPDEEDAWLYADNAAVAEDPDAVIKEDVDKDEIRRQADDWVIDETPVDVVEDIAIDESQFEMKTQQGLQQ